MHFLMEYRDYVLSTGYSFKEFRYKFQYIKFVNYNNLLTILSGAPFILEIDFSRYNFESICK